jgi:ParB-like chromosome segregation protein Spo0J
MQYRKLTELKKLKDNPRTIKNDDFEKLKKSVKDNPDYFEARPLILSNRTGELVIIGGNQRFEAAKAIGLEEVPTHLIEGLTEAREQEITVRDNVNNGNWDFDLLANQFDILELEEWGVNYPDIDMKEMKEKDLDGDVEDKTITCAKCGYEMER